MTIEVSTGHLQEPVATLDTVMACLRRLRSENGAPPIETLEQDGDRAGETAQLSRVVGLVNWEQPKQKSYCGVRRPRGTS
jgi:hypothetical protein